MTTTILKGVHSAYYIRPPTTLLSIAASGVVTGPGAYAISGGPSYAYSVSNQGTVTGGAVGLLLTVGGRVTNGLPGGDGSALISGGEAVRITGAPGTVKNLATLIGLTGAGVYLADGGVVTNSTPSGGAGGLIEGADGVVAAGSATVTNGATIEATASSTGTLASQAYAGASLSDGGSVINGSTASTSALIEGQNGVFITGAAGTVRNFATVQTTGANQIAGIVIYANGSITNGSAADTSALVSGYRTGAAVLGTGTVVNYGTILGGGTTIGHGGVLLGEGGRLTNGSDADTTALIEAPEGVVADANATVRNFGTIETSNFGVIMLTGGVVINGSKSAPLAAAILSYGQGIAAAEGPATVTNFGMIYADRRIDGQFNTGGGVGVFLLDGGRVVNGTVGFDAAKIIGATGIELEDPSGGPSGTVVNFGEIEGTAGDGVSGQAGAVVINGSSKDTLAGIVGGDGVYLTNGTLKNFGYILGYRALADQSKPTGADFSGVLINGDATDSSASIEGADAGVIMVSGTVSNFGTIECFGEGRTVGLQITGSQTVSSGGTYRVTNGAADDARALISGYSGVVADVAATITNFGTIEAFGTAANAVQFSLAGSTLRVEAGSTIMGRILGAGGTLDLASGTGTIASILGPTIIASGALDPFADFNTLEIGEAADFTLTGAGTIAPGGVAALRLDGTLTVTGSLSASGRLDIAGLLNIQSPDIIVSGATTLTGGGTVQLSNRATNAITGASADSLLVNAGDFIGGAGQLGDGRLRLTNEAGGVISGNRGLALVIDTGGSVILNAGIIQATGSGGVTIEDAIDNSGTLIAAPGELTVEGEVTGDGVVRINGGEASFAGAFSQNVAFGTNGGELALAQSQGFAAAITGFSRAGASSLDLEDIAFGDATTASYSGTSKSGVLTVTDGTHTASIALTGNYLSSSFSVSSDGAGGTLVNDPPKTAASLASAMAAFAPASAADTAGGSAQAPTTRPLIAANSG